MITGIWVHPEDPDENDCVIIAYADEGEGDITLMIDSNGDVLPLGTADTPIPLDWTRIFPIPTAHQTITGPVTGTALQAGNIDGGVHLSS